LKRQRGRGEFSLSTRIDQAGRKKSWKTQQEAEVTSESGRNMVKIETIKEHTFYRNDISRKNDGSTKEPYTRHTSTATSGYSQHGHKDQLVHQNKIPQDLRTCKTCQYIQTNARLVR
ncbi:hypothetical protein RvY_19157, partial [Ramazzottius varieornatus]